MNQKDEDRKLIDLFHCYTLDALSPYSTQKLIFTSGETCKTLPPNVLKYEGETSWEICEDTIKDGRGRLGEETFTLDVDTAILLEKFPTLTIGPPRLRGSLSAEIHQQKPQDVAPLGTNEAPTDIGTQFPYHLFQDDMMVMLPLLAISFTMG